MVGIFSVQCFEMKCYSRIIRKCPHKLLSHAGVITPYSFFGKFRIEYKKRSAAYIKRTEAECFIHRYIKAAKTIYTALIAQRLIESLAENYSCIFNSMVTINFKISYSINNKSETAVYGKSCQHMVKKSYACLYFRLSTVKVKLYPYLCFLCLSFDNGASHIISPHILCPVYQQIKAAPYIHNKRCL